MLPHYLVFNGIESESTNSNSIVINPKHDIVVDLNGRSEVYELCSYVVGYSLSIYINIISQLHSCVINH
jgi:hypothetical protein